MARQAPEPRIRMGDDFEREWPGASRLATEAVLNLYIAAALIESSSEANLRAENMPSLSAFNVLTILQGAGEPLPPSVIAERMMITRGTMTGLLSTLEQRGLVERTGRALDGRVRPAVITTAGAELVLSYRHRIHAAEKRLVAGLTKRQLEDLVRALGAIQDAAARLEI